MPRNHQLYFGRTMPFTDKTGKVHAESFWIMNNLNINTVDRSVQISFMAFKSIADFENDGVPLAAVGGTYTRSFSGAAYDLIIAKYGQVVAGTVLTAWEIANAVKDAPNESGEFESFFTSASDVITPS